MQTFLRPCAYARAHLLLVLVAAFCAIGCASTTQQKNETLAASTRAGKAPAKKQKRVRHASKPKSKPKPDKQDKKAEVAQARKPAKKPEAESHDAVVEKPVTLPAVKEAPATAIAAPAPQPEDSRIVLPVKVAFDALVQQIDALVPKTDQKDWTPITRGNDSPKADVKYQLWRDPIKITFSDHTFHITVPVHYAANVRAQVKNPFSKHDWIWIAKNETWGTKAEPQDITASFDAKVGIDDTWQVKSDLRLDDLEHGELPSGKICKNAGIQICVSKAVVAPQVRKHIDAYLRPRLETALAQVEAKVQQAFDLQKRAQAVWNGVQAPQAVTLPGSKQTTWLTVQPSAVGVGQLEMDGPALRIDLSVAGRIAVRTGSKPKVKPVPFPKLSSVGEPAGFHVNAELRVPADALSAGLARELKGLLFDGKGEGKNGKDKPQLSIASAQVVMHADEKHPHRIVVKLALDGALKDDIELHGELAYDAAAQRLSVEHFDYTTDSEDLLQKKLEGFDHAAIRKQIAAKAHWDLAAESAPLKKAIAEALSSTLRDHVHLRGELAQLDVKDFAMDADALSADVILGGALEVDYTP